jgi:glutathione peroxidase
MKNILIALMLFSTNISHSKEDIYSITLKDIDGNLIELNSFKGKYLLFVNVASNCGFTKQYSDLEKLYQQYINDLVVIALPCNQFGGQEPGSSEEIKQFCQKNYGVSFPIAEKIYVSGKNIHQIYSWLTDKEINGAFNSSVKWNFQKYLVSRDGELINYFYSTTNPLSKKITSIINN